MKWRAPAPGATAAPAPRAAAPAAPAEGTRRKLSYKEQREFDALPAQIAAGQKAELMLIISIGRPGTFTERISLQSNAKNAPKSGFVLMVSGRAE